MFERSLPHIRVRFGRDDAAVRAVRRAAQLLAPSNGSDEESTRLGLVISELVSNVIAHTAGGGSLSIWGSRDRSNIRVEVSDSSIHFPVLPRTGFDPGRVHGIQLVNRYCSRWGVVQSPDGKIVWAELPDAAELRTARFDGSPLVTPARPIEREVSSLRESVRPRLNGCLIADIDDAIAELLLIGEFDLPELTDILPTLVGVSHAPPAVVTVDLSGVAYIGAAGIRTLVALAEEVRRCGSRFLVVASSHPVDSIIEATGCRDVLGDGNRRRGFKPR